MRLQCWLAIAVLALTAGCERGVSTMTFEAKPSRRVAQRLADVRRAELFVIAPHDRATASKPVDGVEIARFNGYRILAQGTIEDRDAAREAATLIGGAVLDPPEGIAKGCMFVPHHGVRFVDGEGKAVDVVLCFTCGDALVAGEREWFWLDRTARGSTDALFERHGLTPPVVD